MSWAKGSPLRFIVFMLILALLSSFVLWRWNQQEPPAGSNVSAPGNNNEVVQSPAPAVPDASLDLLGMGKKNKDFSLFIDGRLERDRSRHRHEESLRALLEEKDLSPEARQTAEMELIELNRLMAQEAELENLLRVRGFADAVTFLYPAAGVIVVKGETLSEPEVAQVADLVTRIAGTPLDSISVMARPD